MYTLGFSGGLEPVYPAERPLSLPRPLAVMPAVAHDAAAVLLHDGRIAAAIEEERLDRLKHSNGFPAKAIRFCLREAGLRLGDVDRLGYFVAADMADRFADAVVGGESTAVDPPGKARDLIARALENACGESVDPTRLDFVEHHLAHAASAFSMSGFERALVVTLDGAGDNLSGTVSRGENNRLTRLEATPIPPSLGLFYVTMIRILGYQYFDEYKVMGLAPYGDPSRLRSLFQEICTLQPQGRFQMHPGKYSLLRCMWPPRRPADPFSQLHKDFAAALQETLERAAFHHLEYHRQQTGLEDLCLAGGVCHNSSLVGKIAASRLFRRVFVQPAAGDSGCALGAALHEYQRGEPGLPVEPLKHVYWGTDIGSGDYVARALSRWGALLSVVPLQDTAAEAAQLLADGEVLGWVQGRSEFGPRALGNRSILADPRPAANKERINALIKKREAYRPFAPSVTEELAGEFFALPEGASLGYMTTVVAVREHARELLGAVTHIDGTARVQTVSRESNPRFWALLAAFHRLTGIPILLNTSFNHSVEPIVDSIDDAVTCILTTGLTHLIVGDFLVRKAKLTAASLGDMVVVLPEHVRVMAVRQNDAQGGLRTLLRCESSRAPWSGRTLSGELHEVLSQVDGRRSLASLLHGRDGSAIQQEIVELWAERLILLRPE